MMYKMISEKIIHLKENYKIYNCKNKKERWREILKSVEYLTTEKNIQRYFSLS